MRLVAILALVTTFALAEKPVATGEGDRGGLHLRLNHFAAAALRILGFGIRCPFIVGTTLSITPTIVVVCNGFA